MRNDLYDILKRNDITDIEDFILKSDIEIDVIQSNISNQELNLIETEDEIAMMVPLSKIVGFSETCCKINRSLISNFSIFFDSNKDDEYKSRSLGMLKYSTEEIINMLSKSFNDEPIKTINIDGKYYVSSNGLHRFMILKLNYLIELYKGKSVEELDKKYTIKVSNKNVKTFNLFAKTIGEYLDLHLVESDFLNKKNLLEKIKIKIQTLNVNEYELFINNICFAHFINDSTGEIMIKYLFNYFPSIAINIFKYLITNNYYEQTVNIINCVRKYYPKLEQDFLQYIDTNINSNLENDSREKNFEKFDLNKKWQEYGQSKTIINKERDSERFSEGSASLRKCLKILWNLGIETNSCCKGNHLSINIYNRPEINCEAYISFSESQDWLDYLSPQIINCDEVKISSDAIYYYGSNSEDFFTLLGRDFLTGKKNNKQFLIEKNNDISKELEYKSFVFALESIGFDNEQMEYLKKDYLEIEKIMNNYYSHNYGDDKLIYTEWKNAKKRFEGDLIFYVERNNTKNRKLF